MYGERVDPLEQVDPWERAEQPAWQCQALTKKGHPCPIAPVGDKVFCHIHDPEGAHQQNIRRRPPGQGALLPLDDETVKAEFDRTWGTIWS